MGSNPVVVQAKKNLFIFYFNLFLNIYTRLHGNIKTSILIASALESLLAKTMILCPMETSGFKNHVFQLNYFHLKFNFYISF